MAASGSHQYQAAQEKTITTTGNIDDLDLEGVGLLLMNNASLATIRGFKAGYAGQEVTVVNTNAQVDFAHQNAGSLASSRLINFATSANTSISTGGVATFKYNDSAARWRLIAHDQGAWITKFVVGDFTGNGAMTFTIPVGNVIYQKYKLSGQTLTILHTNAGGAVGGTLNVALQIQNTAWGGFTANTTNGQNAGARSVNNGAAAVAALMQITATAINFFADMTGGTNWANTGGLNTSAFAGTVILDVV